MAVFTYTAKEQVKTACVHNGFLICCAFCLYVRGVSIEDVDVLRFLVYLVKEVLVHKAVVAFRVLHGKSHIFIHIEGDNVLETQFTGLDHADKFCICLNGGGTCAKANHKRLVRYGCLFLDATGNVMSCPQRTLGGVLSDNNFHTLNVLSKKLIRNSIQRRQEFRNAKLLKNQIHLAKFEENFNCLIFCHAKFVV